MDNSKITREQAYENALAYFEGDSLAASVWVDKYALREKGNEWYLENDPDGTWDRMADNFYSAEALFPNPVPRSVIRRLFCDKDGEGRRRISVIPGGSVLAGLGDNNYIGSLSNCMVVGQPEDSYHGIMKSREERVQLMKRRCGVGVDLSSLRPSGSSVNNPAKSSTGPVSFMDVDSGLTNEVAQQGRRGALMISMSCEHPDILDFIRKKQDLTKVTGANISVQLTDSFMDDVMNDRYHVLRWPCGKDDYVENIANIALNDVSVEIGRLYSADELGYDDVSGYCAKPKSYYRKVKAKDYWKELVHCAWNTGEPGIMFYDNHVNYSPDGSYPQYRGVTTNPCGEIFMEKGGACRLISLNYASFVNSPFTENAEFDFNRFSEAVRIGIRLSDDLVTLETMYVDRIIASIDPEKGYDEIRMWKEIKETGEQGRRCGLGLTGLGDMLAMLGLKYDSDEAIQFVEEISRKRTAVEIDEEMNLAKERGVFFGYDKDCEDSRFNMRLRMLFNKEFVEKYIETGRRNVSWSTVAPTGSLSLITQTTSGIEPIFSAYYVRRKKCTSDDEGYDFIDKNGMRFREYVVVHPQMKLWYSIHGENACESAGISYKESIEELNGDELAKVYEYSPWYGSAANDIDWKRRVLMQSAVQKYTTHSISSTINLPKDATEKDVSDIYIEAYEAGLKGITVYRDGCRDGVMVKKEDCGCGKVKLTHDAPKRPKVLPCDVKRFRNGNEKWIALVSLYDGQPYEIFTGLLEKLNIPDYVTKGEIVKLKEVREYENDMTGEMVKKKVSRYDFRYAEKDGGTAVVEGGINRIFNNKYSGYGKLISALLRHGMPLEYVVSTIDGISFDDESINSWKKGVIRAVSSYIADGEVKGEVCPECGGKVVRENGCRHCSNCDWSACQ